MLTYKDCDGYGRLGSIRDTIMYDFCSSGVPEFPPVSFDAAVDAGRGKRWEPPMDSRWPLTFNWQYLPKPDQKGGTGNVIGAQFDS
jgi:hypothetical protein